MIPALAGCLCHSSTQSSTKAVSGLRLDVSNLTPCLLKSQYSPEKSFTCYLPEVAVPLLEVLTLKCTLSYLISVLCSAAEIERSCNPRPVSVLFPRGGVNK